MGNKMGKRRYTVEEKYTRPQGLYQNMDVDRKKLRKLILESKLAPCYPGDEESTLEHEECPICFLVFPLSTHYHELSLMSSRTIFSWYFLSALDSELEFNFFFVIFLHVT